MSVLLARYGPQMSTSSSAHSTAAVAMGTVSDSQSEILRRIRSLHCVDGFDADLTYGNGGFWGEDDLPPPPIRLDIEPLVEGVTQADSRSLPMDDGSLSSVVFDPPFLTYVRSGREGNGGMVMARQFGGYWRYDELAEHYQSSLSEIARVLKPGGIAVFKCQDIVHNHRLHATGANVIDWAANVNLRLLDLFILTANHRLPSPNRAGVQRHARIHHSYFIVLQSVRSEEVPAGRGTRPGGDH